MIIDIVKKNRKENGWLEINELAFSKSTKLKDPEPSPAKSTLEPLPARVEPHRIFTCTTIQTNKIYRGPYKKKENIGIADNKTKCLFKDGQKTSKIIKGKGKPLMHLPDY